MELKALSKSDLIQIAQRQQRQIDKLQFELDQLKRAIFGSKSERFVPTPPEQTSLFETEQAEYVETEPVEVTSQPATKKRKPPVREKINGSLPRQQSLIEPQVDTTGMTKIGEQITEKIAITPPKLYVVQIVRPKYVDAEGQIHIGPYSDPFPKSNTHSSLAAHVAVQKYVDHLPLYRQSKIFARQEANLPRSTLNDMIIRGAKLLQPLYERLSTKVMESEYLQADESSIPVLTKDKPGSTMKGCLLAKLAPLADLVVFDYIKTKEKSNILTSLKGIEGYLQVDGNVSYEPKGQEDKVELMHCLVHSRRYFEKALNYDREKSSHVLTQIKELYLIERKGMDQGFAAQQIHELRQQRSVPILRALKKWLEQHYHPDLPNNPLQTAIRYMLSRWKGLIKYTTNGMLRPDNNLIENQIRPLALGRKNYLFAGSHKGAKYAAIYYSLFGTCRLNGIDPHTWLEDVFNRINEHPINKLDELLPTKNYSFS